MKTFDSIELSFISLPQIKRIASDYQDKILNSSLNIACLHDQNKNGFFGGPAFIQPIRAI